MFFMRNLIHQSDCGKKLKQRSPNLKERRFNYLRIWKIRTTQKICFVIILKFAKNAVTLELWIQKIQIEGQTVTAQSDLTAQSEMGIHSPTFKNWKPRFITLNINLLLIEQFFVDSSLVGLCFIHAWLWLFFLPKNLWNSWNWSFEWLKWGIYANSTQ